MKTNYILQAQNKRDEQSRINLLATIIMTTKGLEQRNTNHLDTQNKLNLLFISK